MIDRNNCTLVHQSIYGEHNFWQELEIENIKSNRAMQCDSILCEWEIEHWF